MHGPQFFFFLLVLAAAVTLACGSSPHVLQSVSVSPATADAQSYSKGQVQFTATAYYDTMPMAVKSAPATWGACSRGANTDGVSVSTNGLAQCAAAAAGNYTVFAFVPDPGFKGVCGGGANPCAGSCGGAVGTAQLTCP